MSSKTVLSLGVLALLLADAPRAQMDMSDQQQVLTIHGTVAADRKAAEKIGYDAILIGFTGAPPDAARWVGVVEAEAGGVDAFLGKELLDQLDGYSPNLLAAGKPAALAPLRNAATGSRVVLSGVLDPGSRMFLVGNVKVTPAASGH